MPLAASPRPNSPAPLGLPIRRLEMPLGRHHLTPFRFFMEGALASLLMVLAVACMPILVILLRHASNMLPVIGRYPATGVSLAVGILACCGAIMVGLRQVLSLRRGIARQAGIKSLAAHLGRRAQADVYPNEQGAMLVELLPPGRERKLLPAHKSDWGVMRVHRGAEVVLIEADKTRWAIPFSRLGSVRLVESNPPDANPSLKIYQWDLLLFVFKRRFRTAWVEVRDETGAPLFSLAPLDGWWPGTAKHREHLRKLADALGSVTTPRPERSA